jgi:hypothetical protein
VGRRGGRGGAFGRGCGVKVPMTVYDAASTLLGLRVLTNHAIVYPFAISNAVAGAAALTILF